MRKYLDLWREARRLRDEAGTQAAVRAYWSNHGFAARVTNDIPNESRLEPKLWGRARIE